MRHIRQKGENDCGLAVAAMIANLSYRFVRSEWKRLYPHWAHEIPRRFGMNLQMMRDLLGDLTDLKWRIVGMRMKRTRLKHWSAGKRLERVPMATIVWRGPGYVGHWIAFDKGIVYDPCEHEPCIPRFSERADFFVSSFVYPC